LTADRRRGSIWKESWGTSRTRKERGMEITSGRERWEGRPGNSRVDKGRRPKPAALHVCDGGSCTFGHKIQKIKSEGHRLGESSSGFVWHKNRSWSSSLYLLAPPRFSNLAPTSKKKTLVKPGTPGNLCPSWSSKDSATGRVIRAAGRSP